MPMGMEWKRREEAYTRHASHAPMLALKPPGNVEAISDVCLHCDMLLVIPLCLPLKHILILAAFFQGLQKARHLVLLQRYFIPQLHDSLF
jgi:hypothetical protein